MPIPGARIHSDGRVATVIEDTETESSPIKMGPYAYGAVQIGAYNPGDLTFKASGAESGTYVDVYDDAGTQVTATVGGTNRIVRIPEAVVGLTWVKLVATNAASGDQSLSLHLKS